MFCFPLSSLPCEMADGDARARIAKRLGNSLSVSLTDGRVLIGRFTCLDKQRNVLLTEAREQAASTSDGGNRGERHVRGCSSGLSDSYFSVRLRCA